MFDKMVKFFSYEEDAKVIEIDSHKAVILILPITDAIQVCPIEGERFRIGPYCFECLLCSKGTIVAIHEFSEYDPQ